MSSVQVLPCTFKTIYCISFRHFLSYDASRRITTSFIYESGHSESASLLPHVLCFANVHPPVLFRLRVQALFVFTAQPSGRFLRSWSSPRPISNSQLHVLPHFHLCPIYLVVFKGSYFFRMGYLILRGASRLDAFSVYPVPTWLLGHEPGGSTDTPEVSPSRSSRTKDSSSQISYAHAG